MFSSENWFGASPSFYNGVATQSLKFDDGSSSYLARTFLTPTNANKFTINVWVKRSNLDTNQRIIGTGPYDGDGELTLFFHTDNTLRVTHYTSGGSTLVNEFITARLFRDTSAWYNIHHIFDSKAGTYSGDNRQQLWVNGVRETSFTGTTVISGEDSTFNTARVHEIGRGNAQQYFDGYMSEINVVDGLALEPSSFGEFKNAIWIAKEPVLSSYGNNGFRLQFKNTGTSTTSEGTTATTNIGDDSSGNGHNFSVNNINSYDCMPDSPENNFSTINYLANLNYGANSTGTYSEGNLKIQHSSSSNLIHAYGTNRINDFLTDGCYFEIQAISVDASRCYVGIVDPESASGGAIASYGFANKALVNPANANYSTTNTVGAHATSPSTTLSISDNNIIGVAVKGTSLWFHVNGTYSRDASNNLGNPSTGANAFVTAVTNIATEDYFPYAGYASSFVFNFGQNPTFNGYLDGTSGKAVGTETPDQGAGVFKYPVPTGFKALCAGNLSDDDFPISPAQSTQAVNHFGILTYTGDGNPDRDIVSGATSIGGEISFTPDWIWQKSRSQTHDHFSIDSNRGIDQLLKISIDSSTTEQSGGNNFTKAFLENGVTIGTDGVINNSGSTYVLWNWKAGGTTPTKTYKVKVVSDSTDFGHGTGSNKYQFFKSDGSTGFGTNGVDLDLQEGGTYTFDWSDSSAQSHPIRFSLTNDGTHSSGTSAGSEYTTGVTKDDSAYLTTITIASGVANLYYYCQNHSGMGAEIRTNVTHGQTNFDGSLLSVSNENKTAGFSIVTYTGTGANATVGHGIGKPDIVLVKRRTGGDGYWTYWGTQFTASTTYIYLNVVTLQDAGGATITNSQYPSDTFFNVGTSVFVNGSSDTYVAYCFHSVNGYSKFGVYNANGDANGNFIFLGFRPAWLMVKKRDGDGTWWIIDAVRDVDNVTGKYLMADSPNEESNGSDYTSFDFVSNGFKIRNTSTAFNSGIHIYMAFAESPFKYANAR